MKRKLQTSKAPLTDAETVSMEALQSYQDALACLASSGVSVGKKSASVSRLRYMEAVEGLDALYQSLSVVAPATPAAPDEEWNPLSQRPHAPLPPPVGGELGLEVTGLKEAVDAFTTLSHEMTHVALWEPFFSGHWRPRSRRQFRDFSLMAEGYCFFFSDIVVSGLVRVRFPDGEFALSRQTPSNALFHPIRAFHALGITSQDEILDIYLEGFTGKETRLLQPRGTSNYVEALAARIYEFYSGTIGYLNLMHEALVDIGALDEFYLRFCDLPGLPTFLTEGCARLANEDFKAYFEAYHRQARKHLAKLSVDEVASIRWRRMLQSRAYYALQVRWFLQGGVFMAKRWTLGRSHRLIEHVESYLDALQVLLAALARNPEKSPLRILADLDSAYEANVRRVLIDHEVWAGQRWLIVPTRAGGLVSIFDGKKVSGRAAKVKILRTVAFLVDELTRHMKASQTVEQRALVLGEIQRVAAIGAACGDGNAKDVKAAEKKLQRALQRPLIREVWSLPLAAFNPGKNLFRELAFSYQ